jgi:hypothetical protein
MTTTTNIHPYTVTDVLRYGGCTYRQFDYWRRHNVFGLDHPRGGGSGKWDYGYERLDMRVCRAMARLSFSGYGSNGSPTLIGTAGAIRDACVATAEDDPLCLTLSPFIVVTIDMSEMTSFT